MALGCATTGEGLIQIPESAPSRSGRIPPGVLDEIGPLPAETPPLPEDLALIAAALEAGVTSSLLPAGAEQAATRPDPWAATTAWRLS